MSNFKISKTPFKINDKQYTRITLENCGTGAYVTLVPEIGGAVEQVCLPNNGKLFTLLAAPNKSDGKVAINEAWLTDYLSSWKGSMLMPWQNRIRDGKYSWRGQSYAVPVNETGRNCALHGLMFNVPMTISKEASDANAAKLCLTYEFKDNPGYPWMVQVSILYTLDAVGFKCEMWAVNQSESCAPFACGWHPYFALSSADTVDKCSLQLQKGEETIADKQLCPTSCKEHGGFDCSIKDLKLDTAFRIGTFAISNPVSISQAMTASTRPEKPKVTRVAGPGATIALWQDSSFPFVQIYTPYNRTCIAIEPTSGPPNAFNTPEKDEQYFVLKKGAGSTFYGSFGVSLE